MMFEKKKQFRLYTKGANGEKRVVEYFELVEQLQLLQKENVKLKTIIKELKDEETKSLKNTIIHKKISPVFDTIHEEPIHEEPTIHEEPKQNNMNMNEIQELTSNLLGR